MPHLWNSTKDAINAAMTICKIIKLTGGKVPSELIDAYKKSMPKTRPGIKAKFFETLTAECPEGLLYFVDSYDTAEEEEEEKE